MGKVRLRVPLLEAGAVLAQKAFTYDARPLNADEKKLLLSIFGASLNLDAVSLAFTDLAVDGRAYTLGNTIRVPEQMPKGTHFRVADLVHEMTHVWQYQTRGTSYISDSIFHQMTAGKAAYEVNLVTGQSFYDYSAEQQAVIVERYYKNAPSGWRQNADVVRMIEEIGKARPLSSTGISQETWFGPNSPAPSDKLGPGPASDQPRTVPLLRIEF